MLNISKGKLWRSLIDLMPRRGKSVHVVTVEKEKTEERKEEKKKDKRQKRINGQKYGKGKLPVEV